MHPNIFNIIPIVFIDAFIIAFIEGLIFLAYISKTEEELITKQVTSNIKGKLGEALTKALGTFDNTGDIGKFVSKTIGQGIRDFLEPSFKSEKKMHQDKLTKAVLLFVFSLLALIIAFAVYWYVVVKVYNKTIDWQFVFAVVGITCLLIGILEAYFVVGVAFEKKVNESEFQAMIMEIIME